jgi:urease accessory protein
VNHVSSLDAIGFFNSLLVGANLSIMEADAWRMRVKRPFLFTNLRSGQGVDQIASFVIEKGGLANEAA